MQDPLMHTSRTASDSSPSFPLLTGALTLTLSLLLMGILAGCDAVGSVEEDESSEDASAAIDAPRGLEAAASDGAVGLAWEGVEGAAGYHVYRSDTSFADPSNATRVSGESPLSRAAYADSAVTNGATYYYRVTAAAAEGAESDASGEASATPLPTPPVRP